MLSFFQSIDYYILFFVFLAYVVYGLTGFGSALVLVPALSFSMPLSQVIPTVLLLDLIAGFLLGKIHYTEFSLRDLMRLLPWMLIGSCLGLFAYPYFDGKIGFIVLGFYVLWVAITGLIKMHRNSHQEVFHEKRARPLNLLLVGFVEFTLGASGPLIAAYTSRFSKNEFERRIMTSNTILLIVLVTLIFFFATSRLSEMQLWQHVVWMVPFGFLGTLLGNYFSKKLPQTFARYFFYVVLLMSGLILLNCRH